MPRTADDFLRAMIGQLVITNAQLAAQIETLQEKAAKPTDPPKDDPDATAR